MGTFLKEKNHVKRLGLAFLLWLVSMVLKYFVGLISIVVMLVYYIVSIKWKTGAGKLADWFENMALSNDQHGNVVNAVTFDLIFSKKGAMKYGNPDDTVSYVLARNFYKGKLTFWGRLLKGILNAIDHKDGGHMITAIENKREADQEAILRHQEDKYYE